jgi:hypothetical protein
MHTSSGVRCYRGSIGVMPSLSTTADPDAVAARAYDVGGSRRNAHPSLRPGVTLR